LDGDLEITAPAEIFVAPGTHTLELDKDGFEPLTHEFNDSGGEDFSLRFVLRSAQPVPLAAEELGLVRRPTLVLRDEGEADVVRKRYNSFAEMFAIVPLGQGVMARIVAGEGARKEANTLILTGIGLTAGSYLLGSILSKRKRSAVRSDNELIKQQNAEGQDHNRQLDKQVREFNAAAMAEWSTRNRDRGRVEVVEESPE
jgi:hypothetical protein